MRSNLKTLGLTTLKTTGITLSYKRRSTSTKRDLRSSTLPCRQWSRMLRWSIVSGEFSTSSEKVSKSYWKRRRPTSMIQCSSNPQPSWNNTTNIRDLTPQNAHLSMSRDVAKAAVQMLNQMYISHNQSWRVRYTTLMYTRKKARLCKNHWSGSLATIAVRVKGLRPQQSTTLRRSIIGCIRRWLIK